jgi:hypothetical protein
MVFLFRTKAKRFFQIGAHVRFSRMEASVVNFNLTYNYSILLLLQSNTLKITITAT